MKKILAVLVIGSCAFVSFAGDSSCCSAKGEVARGGNRSGDGHRPFAGEKGSVRLLAGGGMSGGPMVAGTTGDSKSAKEAGDGRGNGRTVSEGDGKGNGRSVSAATR